jgi:hypothetical protein
VKARRDSQIKLYVTTMPTFIYGGEIWKRTKKIPKSDTNSRDQILEICCLLFDLHKKRSEGILGRI